MPEFGDTDPHINIESIEDAERWINVLNRRSVRDSQYIGKLQVAKEPLPWWAKVWILINVAEIFVCVTVLAVVLP